MSACVTVWQYDSHDVWLRHNVTVWLSDCMKRDFNNLITNCTRFEKTVLTDDI